MVLPKPGKDETEDEFVPRCISTVVDSPQFTEGNTPKGREIASGMCYSQWRNKDKLSKIKNGKTLYLHQLSARIEFTDDSKKEILNLSAFKNMSDAQNGIIRLPRSTLLIGDKLYNNVWHPADELEKSYMTMEHQPFIIDHGEDVEDEIGWMENIEYDPESKKLTAIPVLNLNTAKGTTALNHMRNRLLANKAPETSVGFWATEHMEEIPMLENAQHISARDWEFDHNSLVTRGAGSPEMGIGIGLSKSKTDLNFNDPLKKINQLGDKERMGNEPIIEPKKEPEKFTMSKEEFRAMMKDELEKQEAALKQKQIDAGKPAPPDKTTETDAKDKKIAELEKQLSTRTTATRDTVVNTSVTMDKKTAHIRKRIGGLAYIKYVRDNGSPMSLKYENENQLPKDMR